jgi:hypothetical protein
MKMALEGYRRDIDPVSVFVKEECVEDTNSTVEKGLVYMRFETWCTLDGVTSVPGNVFWRRVHALRPGLQEMKSHGSKRCVKGLSLRG